MRLARRLAFWLVLVIVSLLTLHGVLTVRREIALFDSDTVRDHEVVGRALSSAVGRVWRADGAGHALAILSEVGRDGEGVRARWLGAGSVGPRDDVAHRALSRHQITHVEREAPSGQVELITYVPTELANGVVGLIELREPTGERDAYVMSTMARTAATTLGLSIVSATLMFALGFLFVGRPVRALVDQARRVGAGDLTVKVEAARSDEIGQLANEMNEMVASLSAARDQLALETGARIRALEQLRHADRLATVGRLAAGIAHELGTPLNVVSGRAKMIQQRQELPEPVRDNARIIREQSGRMASIIRELLDFARAGSTRRIETRLGELARQTVALLAPVAAKSKVELIVDEQPDVPVLRIDAGHIQQVLTNLLVNAIQAMSTPGQVRVEIERIPGTVSDGDHREGTPEERDAGEHSPGERVGTDAGATAASATAARGEHVRLSVVDEGVGMDPEVRNRIFEPFYTTKGVGEGTGLGLSVAWGIIAEHGGFIDVESEPGQGSRFCVWLPTKGNEVEQRS